MKVNVKAIQVASNNDTTAPMLNLTKETYIAGFKEWRAVTSGANIDKEEILNLNTKSVANSPYYVSNGEPWYITFDAYTETEASYFSPDGGFHVRSGYYDKDKNSTIANNGNANNGNAQKLVLGEWQNNMKWGYYNGYGKNIKYMDIQFRTGYEGYSEPPVKIRNFKIHGQLDNDFYEIFITKSDTESEIIKTKFAKGTQTADYFINNGTEITGDSFRVYENGIYTVFVKDMAGNTKTEQIEITNII